MSYPWTAGDQLTATDLNAVGAGNLLSLTAGAAFTQAQAAVLAPYQSDGGVKLDTKGAATVASGASLTASVTVGANSNRVLVVFVGNNIQNFTSLTYNGVAMTQVDTQTLFGSGGSWRGAAYILVAPAAGANNLVLTLSGSSSVTEITMQWFSLYNAAQTGQPEVHTTDKSTNSTLSLTTIASGAFVVSVSVSTTGSYGGSATYENAVATGSLDSWDSGQVFPAGTSISLTKTSTQAASFLLSIAPFSAASYRPVLASSAAATNQFYNLYAAFLGFASAAISLNATGLFLTNGIATGFSGLIPGVQYYLNNTAGTIGTAAGTNSRKVGIAMSATTLLITNEW